MTGIDGFLVSTDWLEDHLDDPDVRILDCRYAFDYDARTDYETSHIPGALYLNWSTDLTDPEHEFDGMIAPPEQVKSAMESFGVGDDTLIVGYDQEGGHFASRLWLVMARYGHGDRVKILNGGWTAWVQEDRPVTDEIVEPAGEFTLTLNPDDYRPELIATTDDVVAAMDDESVVILDVRRMSEFTGDEVRAARGGRVPGAVHSLWQENLDWDGDRRFLANDAIQDRAGVAGIDDSCTVITYCQGGVRAAHAAIALMMLGHQNVKVYDGSWAEWGNREELPVETG